ncbi:MAG: hypothetical protein JWQ35_1821 [Bacteriovoracaceae bacterium]|nr:hypothetical protein [Bacteriovoracaceae bacterium]
MSQVMKPDWLFSPLLEVDLKNTMGKVVMTNWTPIALLRLVIQKLCKSLGENESDLSDAIGNLVNKGLNLIFLETLNASEFGNIFDNLEKNKNGRKWLLPDR